MIDVLMAVGEVTAVYPRTFGIYVDVALREHFNEDGNRLSATCALVVPFHGAGYGGIWFLPDIGTDVLCYFPGLSPDGQDAGGNLDQGFAFGMLSSTPEPIPEGEQGALSSTRMVWRGKDDVALDMRVGADLDLLVEDSRSASIGADDALDVAGTRSETFESLEREITGAADVTVDGTEQRETGGAFTWLFKAAVTLTGEALFRIASELIELGTGTRRKLVDERLFTYLASLKNWADNHAHTASGVPPSVPSPTAPTATDCATEHTKAS